MKYYIPTSSRNIESILSTESISPISYYADRPFGSKFFQGIPEIKLDHFIYLFSEVPLFCIPDSDVEQYPVALEIDDEVQLKKLDTTLIYEDNGVRILSCCKTIVLTPWNCRIIYYDERAYLQSRLTIEASRNCKIGLRFQWVFCDKGILLDDMASRISEDMPGDGPDDLAFNVEKGAIWGYVLGCSRSIPERAAKLVSISNRMRNIASNAISNSGECGPSFYAELKELDKVYRDIADKEASEQWNQTCPPEERSILAKFQVLKEALYKFLRNKHLSMAPEIPYSRDSKDAWTRYRDALNAYTEGFVNKKRQDSTTISWNEISVLDGRILLNDCELINSLLKRISQGLLNKDQIRISREASMKVVLSDISAILQNRLGQDTWDLNPKERLYINQLYKNITNFEPFNLNSINNEELKAIAAFLLKGEDYEALIRYLEDNGVANYRLVLCLWGAIEGYASIHKVLLSMLLSADNVCRVNTMLGLQEINKPFPTLYSPHSISLDSANTQNSRGSKCSESAKEMDVASNKEEKQPHDGVVSKSFEEAFLNFFTPFVKKCRAAERDRLIYRRLFSQCSGVTLEFYEAVVAETSLNRGKGAQNNVLNYLGKLIKPSEDEKTRIREKQHQKETKAEPLNLFSLSVIDDDEASC